MSKRNEKICIGNPSLSVNFSEPGDLRSQSLIVDASTSSSRVAGIVARFSGHPMVLAAIFGLIGLMLLLTGIGRPAKMYFDEGYFVPEARAFLRDIPNPAPSTPPLAKPPLAKLIMAVGMKVAGDNPFGWRIAGAVCGALTIVAVYLWTYLLLRRAGLASLAAGLTLFDNFWFVMSRIATADVFLMVFLVWSLVAYTAALALQVGAGVRRLLFCLSGVLVGLAGACKWNAIDTLAVFVLVSFVLLWVSRRMGADSTRPLAGYARNVEQIGVPVILVGLFVAPLLSYSLAFWPLCRLIHLPFNFHQVAAMNAFMWRFNRTTGINPAIISSWYTWPLNLKPQRVLSYLVGNPVITWSGLLALAVCVRRCWNSISLPEGLVLLLFASNYFQWAVTPQKGLYYYYYYPCVMVLGVSLAVALRGSAIRVVGTRLNLLLLVAAAVVFTRCYGQMAHLEAPWDCMLGCW